MIFSLNSINLRNFKNWPGFYLKSDSNIGGEVTEIVSAAPVKESIETQKETSLLPSAFAAAITPGDNFDSGFEDTLYDDRSPLITGEDSILQNQNQIIPAPESTPAPSQPVLPRYAAGPYLEGYFIFPTSGFNRGKLHAYNAIDISHGNDCLSENIPIFAAASGIVSAVYPTDSINRYANGGYGNNILILHPNGVLTRYAHLKNIFVSGGQYINQGSIIAYMGGYPRTPGAGNSTGCHLHFEVRGAKNPFAR